MKMLSLLLSSLVLCGPLGAQTLSPREPGRTVMVLAHRSCWEGGAPENSLAAIHACETVRPDMIEIDVRKTSDGQFVLMHDETVDRTTNGQGRIADLTFAQVRALRLRAGDGGPNAPLTELQVPTLEEGLQAAKGKFIVNLHLYVPAEAAMADIAKRLGMAGELTTWVGDKPDSDEMARYPLRGVVYPIPVIKPCAGTDEQCGPTGFAVLERFAPHRPAGYYLIPDGALASDAGHDYVRAGAAAPRPAGSRLMVSTLFGIDKLPHAALVAEWRKLVALGADLIMTDHPGALLDMLRQDGARATAQH